MENVIIYQIKNKNGKWGSIQAYIPENEADYIRVCKLNGNASINICDVFNANNYDEIEEKMSQYYYLEEDNSDEREIFDARR